MRTVSFQGLQISPKQREQLAQRQAVKAFMNPHLTELVNQSLAAADKHREEGGSTQNPNKFFVESSSKGTPFLGDVFEFSSPQLSIGA